MTTPDSKQPKWAGERIQIVDYDPAWVDNGVRERVRVQDLLKPWLTGEVEHIGSTAVPGLAAKPILDLQAPVSDLSASDAVAAVLAPHSWHYVPPELNQRPYRRFYVKVVDNRRAAHLHLMSTASARWHQQLAFRDALRADPDLIRAYARLKTDLAVRHRNDREAYTVGKRRFVEHVLGCTP
ncbi:MAG: GrpB family protein [Pseudonocardia sp.]